MSNSSEARDRGKAKLRTLKPGSNTVVSHSSDKSSSEARDRGKAKSRTLKPGSSVQVLFNSHSVAQATVMEGTLLHGKDIPSGYVKITINSCKKDIQVPLQIVGTFDEEDDVLSSGLITAWKLANLISDQ